MDKLRIQAKNGALPRPYTQTATLAAEAPETGKRAGQTQSVRSWLAIGAGPILYFEDRIWKAAG